MAKNMWTIPSPICWHLIHSSRLYRMSLFTVNVGFLLKWWGLAQTWSSTSVVYNRKHKASHGWSGEAGMACSLPWLQPQWTSGWIVMLTVAKVFSPHITAFVGEWANPHSHIPFLFETIFRWVKVIIQQVQTKYWIRCFDKQVWVWLFSCLNTFGPKICIQATYQTLMHAPAAVSHQYCDHLSPLQQQSYHSTRTRVEFKG